VKIQSPQRAITASSQVVHATEKYFVPAAVESITTTTLEELQGPFAATTSDRCPNCNARMARDQRYCIECGERRSGGGLREALPRTQPATTAAPAKARRRVSPNASLIAGVATLLLAMGVGVLIGRSGHGDPAPTRSASPQIITVPSATGTTASGTTHAAAATAATAKAVKHKRAKVVHAKTAKTSTAQTDIQKTAAKSGVKLPPPVIKVGQKCPKGAAGCQGGKFTGNFFGGGG
jgi:hypothetical protein